MGSENGPIFERWHDPKLGYEVALPAVGRRSSYAPAVESALVYLPVMHSHMDFKSRELTYTLPQMGMVRTRIFRDDHLLIRTLLDWTPQLAGNYKTVWDGNDSSGHPVPAGFRLNAFITAYTLPQNAFIIKGTGKTKAARSLKDQNAWRANPKLQDRFTHARVPREQSHEPRVTLSYLNEKDGSELPAPLVISQPVSARVSAPSDDANMMTDERFEVCIYVDGVFLFEDEDGVIPYTFELDPKGLNAGTHLLSVMVMTTGDHVSTVSSQFKVQYENSKAVPGGGR